MEAAHLGSGNRICTVVFVDIVRYGEELVSRQVEMKAQFAAFLATALEHTPVADRLVLDTGDGAALCFLGDPEDGLFAANSLRSAVLVAPESAGLQLRLGINVGPVRVVKDINGQPNVLGDAINVAQRVMTFAAPNQILVSRSYYEMVSRLSPEYGQLFHYIGFHRDKHVREHEVYEVQLAPGRPGAAADVLPAGEPSARPAVGTERASPFDPALLERLTTALAREIGPVAKLIVRRAAVRAADERMLCAALVENVPAPSRAAFLAGLADLAGGERRAAAPSAAPAVAPPGSPTRAAEIGPDLLARAEQMLSRQIGPLAPILVREAAKHARSPRDLFERLAIHIDNEDVRKLFIAEADQPA